MEKCKGAEGENVKAAGSKDRLVAGDLEKLKSML